jgi:hypothetical protein
VALSDVLDVAGAEDARRAVARMGGLASQADLARRWGTSRQRVNQLTREPGFPAPGGEVNGQAVWFAAQADHWREYRDLFIAEAALAVT